MKKCITLIFLFICINLLLIGCSTTDIDGTTGEFNSSFLSEAEFNYDDVTNKTFCKFYAEVKNLTIYNCKTLTMEFQIFDNEEFLQNEEITFNVNLNHGKTLNSNFTFEFKGKCDKIKFYSGNLALESFWQTYKIWIIVISSIVIVALIAYIIYIFVSESELSDVWDDLSLGEIIPLGIIFYSIFGTCIVGGGISFIFADWIIGLLIIGGLIAFAILALLAHLIQHIIYFFKYECTWDLSDCFACNRSYDDFYEKYNETDDLSSYTVEELKEYCKLYGIKGYSNLRKNELIDLIIKHKESCCEEADEDGEENKIDGEIHSKKKQVKIKKPINNITFNDIAGLEEAKEAFKEKVILPMQYKELYEKYGKKSGGGILLYGLPGTGKTMFAQACSNELNALFISVKCSDIKSKWYGESENKVKSIFSKAKNSNRAIIFFDEFEAIGAKRTDDSDNGNNDLVPQILAEMQGFDNNGNSSIMVIAATNKPWAIDSAFLRPGRFDEKIYIPLPDYEARKKLFELKLKGIPCENLDYNYLSEITDGFNGADITEFCEKLKMEAIKDSLKNNENACPITMEYVHIVESKVKTSVKKEEIEQLQEFENNY